MFPGFQADRIPNGEVVDYLVSFNLVCDGRWSVSLAGLLAQWLITFILTQEFYPPPPRPLFNLEHTLGIANHTPKGKVVQLS